MGEMSQDHAHDSLQRRAEFEIQLKGFVLGFLHGSDTEMVGPPELDALTDSVVGTFCSTCLVVWSEHQPLSCCIRCGLKDLLVKADEVATLTGEDPVL